MAKYENTVTSFKKFLEDFCAQDSPSEDSPLPFRLQSYTITEDEIRGEILDWAIAYLDMATCPDILKFAITKSVADSIISCGLEKFKKVNETNGGDNDDGEEKDITVYYSATPIAKATFINVHQVCSKWNEELPNLHVPPHLNEYSLCGIKNLRRKMEDKHTVITNLNALVDLKDQPQTQYYAVFDGHGGVDASSYAAKQLHLNLVQQESFPSDIEDALKKTILQIDEHYCRKAHRESLRSGTTAVVSVIRENVLHLAWIGDSQAVLVRDGHAVTLMNPHKPDREDEKQRIENLGGCVIWFGAWRVNGTLSVSRAIGDADHKPYVSGDADSSRTELTGDEDYLCIACDGFWDVYTGEQLASLVSEHMRESGDKSALARYLCTKAKAAGSSDNITVLIIFLRDNITITNGNQADSETVENEDQKEGAVKEGNLTNTSDQAAAENSAKIAKDNNLPGGQKIDSKSDGNVMIQGRRMRPSIKDRPPHKILVNKPQAINTKNNVIVTKSSPHRRLPRSVVTHKSPWQSPQVSPKMRRRDTRGSLVSWGLYESDEVTMPIRLWSKESQTNDYYSNAHGFFPALLPGMKNGTRNQTRVSPSPSCTSEPSIIEDKVLMTTNIHHPSRRTIYRQYKEWIPHRSSINMGNMHLDENGNQYSQRKSQLTRRISHSVPDNLNKMQDSYVPRRPHRPQSLVGGVSHNPTAADFNRRASLKKGVFDPVLGVGSDNPHLDTDIAITNSLHNKIKPKTINRENRFSTGNGMTKFPLKFIYKRQRSSSAL